MLVFPLDKEIAGNCLLDPRVIGELVLVGCDGSIVGRFRVLRLIELRPCILPRKLIMVYGVLLGPCDQRKSVKCAEAVWLKVGWRSAL